MLKHKRSFCEAKILVSAVRHKPFMLCYMKSLYHKISNSNINSIILSHNSDFSQVCMSGVRLHNFTFLSISILNLIMKSFSLYLPLNTLVTVDLPISSKSAISLFSTSVYFLRFLMYSFLISDILFRFCVPFYFIYFYFSDFFNYL
jgi:hypothetical protein